MTTAPIAPTGKEQPAATFGRCLLYALAALAVSLVFFSPRWWILAQPMPGSTYWDRGLQFMQQAANPLSPSLTDAGLTWRLAPATLAWLLGLRGYAALLVPWAGLVLMLTLAAWLVSRRAHDRKLALGTTALLATTSATLTVTGWLGMNDAWYASALLVAAFLPSRSALVIAVLSGPWIDERFVLALPLALWVRHRALGGDGAARFSWVVAGIGVGLYGTIRLTNPFGMSTELSSNYLQSVLSGLWLAWLPYASLGWFMGLRAAWVLVFAALLSRAPSFTWRTTFWPATLAVGAVAAITVVAADTGRTTTMLLPLVLLGVEALVARHGIDAARRWVGGLLLANLLLPAMHVTYKHPDLINALPFEVIRYLRHG